MVCCNGKSCCSCFISIYPVGIRTCGQKTSCGGVDYFCDTCGQCNSDQPACSIGKEISKCVNCSDDTLMKDLVLNKNSNTNAFNPSYSSYGIYKTKRDIISKELDNNKDKIYLNENPGENIQYLLTPTKIEINSLYSKWSIFNQLTRLQKQTLYKTLINSSIRNNNINLNYNIYLKLTNKGVVMDSGDLQVYINSQVAIYLAKILINTNYNEILKTYTFDQLFRLIYNYLILHMNNDKYFLVFHIGGALLRSYGKENSQNIV